MRVQARAGGSWQDNARNRAELSLISDLQRVGKTRVGDAWTRVRAPFTTINVYTRCSEQYQLESMGSSFKTMIAKLRPLSLSLSHSLLHSVLLHLQRVYARPCVYQPSSPWCICFPSAFLSFCALPFRFPSPACRNSWTVNGHPLISAQSKRKRRIRCVGSV